MEKLSTPDEKLFDDTEFLEPDLIEFYRADAELICESCSKTYGRHPDEPAYLGFDDQPYLRRLCNGDLIKL